MATPALPVLLSNADSGVQWNVYSSNRLIMLFIYVRDRAPTVTRTIARISMTVELCDILTTCATGAADSVSVAPE